MAVRGNAGLSRQPDRDARFAGRPFDQAARSDAVARGSGSRIVVLRSRRVLPDPQGRTAQQRAGAVQWLDQRPQTVSGRRPRRNPRRRRRCRPAEIQSVRQCLARRDRGHLRARPILPPHPLAASGFLSIGCMPCTSRTSADEDARAGRWRGRPRPNAASTPPKRPDRPPFRHARALCRASTSLVQSREKDVDGRDKARP